MGVLLRSQVYGYASQAGFKGAALDTIVAIAYAESTFNTDAKSPPNWDGSIDRGLYQINSKAHPDVSNTCAYDATCSSAAAYRISSGGSNFIPWTTYTSGKYKQYLTNGPVTGTPNNGGNDINIKNVNLKWLDYGYLQANAYVTTYKGGDTPHWAYDYQTPYHTTLTSLVNGTVSKVNYNVPWGSELWITPDSNSAGVPGQQGIQLLYYHMDTITVRQGQHVTIGQTIGLSGGQTSGGSHPVTDSQYSSGPHTHVQWWTSWTNTVVGSRGKGPDIGPYIKWLQNVNKGAGVPSSGATVPSGGGTLGIPTFTSLLSQVHETLTTHDGFYSIALALDEAEQFPGFINMSTSEWDVVGHIRSVGATVGDNFLPFTIRSMLVGLGVLIVVLLIIKSTLDAGEKVMPLLTSFL